MLKFFENRRLTVLFFETRTDKLWRYLFNYFHLNRTFSRTFSIIYGERNVHRSFNCDKIDTCALCFIYFNGIRKIYDGNEGWNSHEKVSISPSCIAIKYK